VTTPRSGHGRLLIGVVCVALLARTFAAIELDRRLPKGLRNTFGDTAGYLELGENIARARDYEIWTYHWRVFRAPGYPLLVAASELLHDEAWRIGGIVSLNVLCGLIAVLAVYWLARMLFDSSSGLLAAAVTAVYPGAVTMSMFILSEALFAPLLVLQLGTQVSAWHSKRRWGTVGLSLLAGCLAGAASLTRPSWLLFVPFSAAAAVVVSRQRLKHLACAGCMLVGLIIVMLPWWVRNYRVTGHVVLTTLQFGVSLGDGLSPIATGGSDIEGMWAALLDRYGNDRDKWTAACVDPLGPRGEFSEYDQDRLWRRLALQWAREHPGRVLQLAAIKFTRMWNVWPNEPQFRSWPVRLAVFVSYVPIMVLACWGAWKFRDRGWPCVLCWLPAVYLTLLHMVFVSSIRYREPAMLPLIVLAAGAAVSWWQGNKGIKSTSQVNTEGGTP
jgi:4-amino-4-deoxy-L-arabinose transferase-like glycosyltransferase